MTVSGGAARTSVINGRRSLLATPLGWARNSGSAVSRAWLRRSPRAQAWDAGAGRGGDGCGDGVQGSGPGDRVLDAEQAPVGGVADLPQRGQIRRSFPDPEIVGVGDDGLGARGIPLLLDRGVFVVHAGREVEADFAEKMLHERRTEQGSLSRQQIFPAP